MVIKCKDMIRKSRKCEEMRGNAGGSWAFDHCCSMRASTQSRFAPVVFDSVLHAYVYLNLKLTVVHTIVTTL